MIKNIVFDIGMVLVDYDWKKCLKVHGFPPEIQDAVAEAVFLSETWIECDRGVLTSEELLKSFINNAPEYEKEIQTLFFSMESCIKQYSYTIPWLSALKKKGFGLYYLSNYGELLHDQTLRELQFIDLMDGGVFSYEVKLIKPDSRIYKTLLDRYHLDPSETLFFDDNQDNIQGALETGMHAALFTGFEKAQEDLLNALEK